MKNTPSIYPHLVAEFIENDKDGGTVEAIAFITRTDLEALKNEKEGEKKANKIIQEAREREEHIFASLETLSSQEGELSFVLTKKMKKNISPIISDIYFLYEHRLGEDAAKKLGDALLSSQDEPYIIIIHYKKEYEKNQYFIKKISFKKIPQ